MLLKKPPVLNGTSFAKCPECNRPVNVITSGKGIDVTIKIQCRPCHRKIVKSGERSNYDELKHRILATWNDSLLPTMDDDL